MPPQPDRRRTAALDYLAGCSADEILALLVELAGGDPKPGDETSRWLSDITGKKG